jgi:hypothetical protein
LPGSVVTHLARGSTGVRFTGKHRDLAEALARGRNPPWMPPPRGRFARGIEPEWLAKLAEWGAAPPQPPRS